VPVFVGAALLVAGCSSSPSTGSGGTSATSSSPASSVAPAAPKVTDPLPASVFDKHPCDSALTADQLKQLISDAPPSYRTDNAAGPGCGWDRKDAGTIIDVAWMTGVRGGLGQVYAAQEQAPFRQPTEVDGYPGLLYNPNDQPTRICHIAVGIADNLVFDASLNARVAKVDRCEGAKQIAQKVLANLKAAAGK
jgi:hypothetical protein